MAPRSPATYGRARTGATTGAPTWPATCAGTRRGWPAAERLRRPPDVQHHRERHQRPEDQQDPGDNRGSRLHQVADHGHDEATDRHGHQRAAIVAEELLEVEDVAFPIEEGEDGKGQHGTKV